MCRKPPVKPVRSIDPVRVPSVSDPDCPLWTNVKVEGQWIRMLVDMGAAVSTVPIRVSKISTFVQRLTASRLIWLSEALGVQWYHFFKN